MDGRDRMLRNGASPGRTWIGAAPKPGCQTINELDGGDTTDMGGHHEVLREGGSDVSSMKDGARCIAKVNGCVATHGCSVIAGWDLDCCIA